MKAKTKVEAWKIADELISTDYNKDDIASEKAGYPIFRSPIKNEWISDLGDRLEVNLENGKTVNIWISGPEFTQYAIEDCIQVIDEAIYQIEDNVLLGLQERIGLDKIHSELYGCFAKLKKIIEEDYPDSELIKKYNL